MQTEKEGSLSFAEAIIKVDIEYHMMHECMFCELEATKVNMTQNPRENPDAEARADCPTERRGFDGENDVKR